MKKFTTLLLLVSPLTFAAPWVSNRDHSEISFKVPYMGVSELTGRFNEFSGEAEVSDDGTFQGPLKVVIKSSSVDTGNKMRDSHLERSDFFYVQKYPAIVFTSDKITKKKTGVYTATGTLELRGVSRIETFEFTSSDALKDTWGHPSRFVKFTSTLNRKNYGFNWNKTLDGQEFLVGDAITISGVFQMQPPRKKTPNSKHMIPDNEYIRQRDRERQKNESSISKKLRSLINGN